jgi:hypothetical protein
VIAGNAVAAGLLLIGPSQLAITAPDRDARVSAYFYDASGTLLFLAYSIPAVVLLLTTGRLSSSGRDRRLAALRVLGLGQGRVRVVAAFENGLLALIGGLVGAAVFKFALAALVDRTMPLPNPPMPTFVEAAAAVVVVTAVSAWLGTATTWERLPPAGGRRLAGSRTGRPGVWRLAVLAAGLAPLAWVASRHDWYEWRTMIGGDGYWSLALAVVAGGALVAAVGVALSAPLATVWLAGALARSNRVWLRLAGRGLEVDWAGPGRVAAGVGVAAMVSVTALGLSGAGSGSRDTAIWAYEGGGPQVIALSPDPAGGGGGVTAEDLAGVLAVPGVIAVGPRLMWANCDQAGCVGAVGVGTCEQLELFRGVEGCDDSRAARVEYVPPTELFAGELGDDLELWAWPGDGEPVAAVSVAGEPIVLDGVSRLAGSGADYAFQAFVPAALLPADLSPPGRVDLVADGGQAVQRRVARWASANGLLAQPLDQSVYREASAARLTTWSVVAAALGVAALIMALAAIDRVRARRRSIVRQMMVGVPAGILRRGEAAQMLLPALVAAGLGLGAGGLLTAAVLAGLTAPGTESLSAAAWAVAIGLTVGCAAGAAATAWPLIRTRIDPDSMGRE